MRALDKQRRQATQLIEEEENEVDILDESIDALERRQKEFIVK